MTDRRKYKSRCIGVSIITVFTILAAIIMELSHLSVWAEWFEDFAPHYSESGTQSDTDDLVAEIDTLNIAKTTICGFVIVFGLLLRMSHLLL